MTERVLFTGYIASDAGVVLRREWGRLDRSISVGLQAISDEWLLDRTLNRQNVAPGGVSLGQSAVSALRALTSGSGFTVSKATAAPPVGVFVPEPTQSWSVNAGALAGSAAAAYRVIGGGVDLQPAGAVTHTLSDGDGSLHLGSLRVSSAREVANDITLSGEIEPGAYIAESFAGDGTTSVFTLSKAPFHPAGGQVRAQLLSDSFDAGAFDPRVWTATDPGSHFSFTASGLTLTGGNGFDGQTTLAAVESLEIGGSLVLEMGSVRLDAASDGVLCGLYTGDASRANCFAGYNVRQSNGSTVVAAMVNGAEVGTVFPMQQGHAYTLRVRVHCVEVRRVRQIFYAMVSGAVTSFGGGLVTRRWSWCSIFRILAPRRIQRRRFCIRAR